MDGKTERTDAGRRQRSLPEGDERARREKVAVRFRGGDDWLSEAVQPWRCRGIPMSACGKMKVLRIFLKRTSFMAKAASPDEMEK